jgi:hypothetical protein
MPRHFFKVQVAGEDQPKIRADQPGTADYLKFFLFIIRSSLGCIPSGRSSTSSKNIVPGWAGSNMTFAVSIE